VKIVTVVGSKKGGKTTVVCRLVEQLKASGHKVVTVKFFERVASIDVSDKETELYRRAGSDLTIASGVSETAILKKVDKREDLAQLLTYVSADADFVICEGIVDESRHRIVAVREPSDIEEFVNENTFAISGVVAGKHFTHRFPIVDVIAEPEKLAALVISLT
jgi:molybdopterin-guanine dinucleotide biosynthesis protein B